MYGRFQSKVELVNSCDVCYEHPLERVLVPVRFPHLLLGRLRVQHCNALVEGRALSAVCLTPLYGVALKLSSMPRHREGLRLEPVEIVSHVVERNHQSCTAHMRICRCLTFADFARVRSLIPHRHLPRFLVDRSADWDSTRLLQCLVERQRAVVRIFQGIHVELSKQCPICPLARAKMAVRSTAGFAALSPPLSSGSTVSTLLLSIYRLVLTLCQVSVARFWAAR